MSDYIVANGVKMERCRFYSFDCRRCVLHNTRCPCEDYNPEQSKKPRTNADRICAMSDEELAEFLWSIGQNPATGNTYLNGKFIFFCGDGNGWLDWLRKEAE